MVKSGNGRSGDKVEEVLSRSGESSKYKGVRKRKWGKWVSEIRLPNSRERIWLGSYDSAEKAARAFDAAIFCLRGPSAGFNFPDTPPEIDGGRFLSRSEIQAAAAKFANSYSTPTVVDASHHHPTIDSPCRSSIMSQIDRSCENGMLPEEPYFDLQLNFPTDYGIFPGFDDLNNGFVAIPPPHQEYPNAVDYLEEESVYESSYDNGSFLWNF